MSPRGRRLCSPGFLQLSASRWHQPWPVGIYGTVNVPEGRRNTGPCTGDGRARHSPVNKNVNRFKEFQAHVAQWFITFETLVERFGFFPSEKYACLSNFMCDFLGALLRMLGPQRKALWRSRGRQWEGLIGSGRDIIRTKQANVCEAPNKCPFPACYYLEHLFIF